MGKLVKSLKMRNRMMRKRAYVKIVNIKDTSIREVIWLKEKPAQDIEESGYIVGPFRYSGGAELYKAQPDKFKTPGQADAAFTLMGVKE